MCKTYQINRPNPKRFPKMFSTTLGAVVLGLLCSLPVSRASAQTCLKCPTDAQSSAIGDAFDVLVVRNGQTNRVSGKTVGACETLILNANVSYNPNGTGGGIGAGFTAGTGHYILLKRGAAFVAELISDNTPADMTTTLVVPVGAPNSCPPVGGTTQTPIKDMEPATYTLTAADIAAGSLQFEFEYTNGIVLNPNQFNQCVDRVQATPQVNVFIAPFPTCTVTKHCLTATNRTGNAVEITFSGTVSNTGSTTLTNIVVVNNQPVP